MRGKGDYATMGANYTGITPACAGKRMAVLITYVMDWDHPRMCGEKEDVVGNVVGLVGSPPHVRGKVRLDLCQLVHERITPACAGKRRFDNGVEFRDRDHPRMCGEKTKKIP